MQKKTVYVAGPYTLGDVAVNVHEAIHVADLLLGLGFIPYVPHLTHFWHLMSPKPWDIWIELGMPFLLKCDYVLRLNGKSKGADIEVEAAKKANIPVFVTIPQLVKYAKEHNGKL